ncbi:MAG: DUF2834 domain-containing protein [Chloroflexi bacterium]|nr:DUF2834 domain-containing protein [Chloroflexota bacterium]
MLKNFYLLAMIIGTIVPWLFFGNFFLTEGVNPARFVSSLFVNGAAGGFSADVIISLVIFWVWSYADSRKHDVRPWWIVLPASFTVGLSLALPLYLYLRADSSPSA